MYQIGVGHRMENCRIKSSFCSGMGHTKDRCWKFFGKGPSTSTNFLEVMVMMKKLL
jgi:hypothetical protein